MFRTNCLLHLFCICPRHVIKLGFEIAFCLHGEKTDFLSRRLGRVLGTEKGSKFYIGRLPTTFTFHPSEFWGPTAPNPRPWEYFVFATSNP